jgi:hypothetical protein
MMPGPGEGSGTSTPVSPGKDIKGGEIQSNFVDDPRSSVAEAHALVSGMVDRVVQQLQEQLNQLEQS